MQIVGCCDKHYGLLSEIWKRSVRASHSFLSEIDIIEIKRALPAEYFPKVELYALIDNNMTVGFIGLSANMIEMLFIDDAQRGRGYGTALIEFAKSHGATKVDVNEQNPSALQFYKAKGFRVTGRDETDEAGRPYPILHLSL